MSKKAAKLHFITEWPWHKSGGDPTPAALWVCNACGVAFWAPELGDRRYRCSRLCDASKGAQNAVRRGTAEESAEAEKHVKTSPDSATLEARFEATCAKVDAWLASCAFKPGVPCKRIGWLDSTRAPSRVHMTQDDGATTICGHKPLENHATGQWVIVSEVPRKRLGQSRYCRTCFKDVKRTVPWLVPPAKP